MMFWSGTFEYTSVDGRAVHDTFNEIKIGTAVEKHKSEWVSSVNNVTHNKFWRKSVALSFKD